jgi:PAS domain S-box-containing protein
LRAGEGDSAVVRDLLLGRPMRARASREPLQVLYEIVSATADATGDVFFEALVKAMARALDVRGALVSLFTSNNLLMVNLAFWDRQEEELMRGMEYDLSKTPCREVAKGKLFHCPVNVRELFPDDPHLAALKAQSYCGVPMVTPSGHHVGHVAVIDGKPMPTEARFHSIMKVFATRCAAELDRLAAHKEVVASQRRLNAILCDTRDAIIVVDDAAKIELFNHAARTMFGFPRVEMEGHELSGLASPTLIKMLEDFMAQETHQSWFEAALPAQRKNGDRFRVDATVSATTIDERRFFTMIVRDVEEREQSRRTIEHLTRAKHVLAEQVRRNHDPERIVGGSGALAQTLELVDRVASSTTTVLLRGETGTGKELVARRLHEASDRHGGPFVTANCAAMPASLIDSVLFGHEAGAFTGALKRRLGRFELAHNGTLFLDEIGEVPIELQPKLLRVLQENQVERVGGNRTFDVNVRVVAATNQPLEDLLETGRFREDLFYRLNVFPIHLPPLRDRGDDVVELACHFLELYARRMGRDVRSLSEPSRDRLRGYRWPGNVRELQNIVERAVILSDGPELDLTRAFEAPPTLQSEVSGDGMLLVDVERRHIEQVLERVDGRIEGRTGAAALLGLRPSTLRSRMRKLGMR